MAEPTRVSGRIKNIDCLVGSHHDVEIELTPPKDVKVGDEVLVKARVESVQQYGLPNLTVVLYGPGPTTSIVPLHENYIVAILNKSEECTCKTSTNYMAMNEGELYPYEVVKTENINPDCPVHKKNDSSISHPEKPKVPPEIDKPLSTDVILIRVINTLNQLTRCVKYLMEKK